MPSPKVLSAVSFSSNSFLTVARNFWHVQMFKKLDCKPTLLLMTDTSGIWVSMLSPKDGLKENT